LRLMGKKLLVAITIAGKFAGEGLQNIDDDDDMLSAMARELVEKNGIGESADAIWKTLHQEHEKLFATQEEPSKTDIPEETPDLPEAGSLIESALDIQPALIFGQNADSFRAPRRRSRPPIPEQPSL